MYLEDLIKILELIKNKHDDMPTYLLNKEYDLFAEINRVYLEVLNIWKLMIYIMEI